MASVDIVIPVLNEEGILVESVASLRAFLRADLADYTWRITVVDNGSTDHTLAIATHLAAAYPGEVRCLHLDQRGKGLALRRALLESDCDVVSYMDVDLSAGLEAFPLMLKAITEEGFHIASGSRLMRGAQVGRSFKREAISRAYNLLIKLAFQTGFSDAHCGFKALSRAAAQVLVPVVQNDGWFFDAELLIIAEKRGFRIKDIPIRWKEDPDSRVHILRTAMEDLRGLVRLRLGGVPDVRVPTSR